MLVKAKKILTTLATGIAGCLLIAQFITIQRTNPSLKGDLAAPPQIKSLLREAATTAIPTKAGGLGTPTSLRSHGWSNSM